MIFIVFHYVCPSKDATSISDNVAMENIPGIIQTFIGGIALNSIRKGLRFHAFGRFVSG